MIVSIGKCIRVLLDSYTKELERNTAFSVIRGGECTVVSGGKRNVHVCIFRYKLEILYPCCSVFLLRHSCTLMDRKPLVITSLCRAETSPARASSYNTSWVHPMLSASVEQEFRMSGKFVMMWHV